jgi:hypothetical protein
MNQPDNNILAIQKIFNNNPFELKYNGEVDGFMNEQLKNSLISLGKKIQELTGANVSDDIIQNDKIITTADELTKTFELLKKFKTLS